MTVRGPNNENNIQPYHGMPKGVKPNYKFDAPVSIETEEFLLESLSEIYPNSEIEIVGSFFDYSQSTDPMAYKGSQGYFRVKIDGKDLLLTSLIHDGQKTYQTSDIVVKAISKEGINVSKAIPLNAEKQFTHGVSIPETKFNDDQVADKVYLALEEYPFGHEPVMQTGIQGAEFELGEITGRVFVANRNVSEDEDIIALEKAASVATFKHLDKVFNELQDKDSEFDIRGIIPVHYADLIDKLIYQRDEGEYRLSCYNNIEKFITRTSDGIVLHAVHDSASIGGMLPMMTENATYDAGLTLARVIMNQGFYKDVDGKAMTGEPSKQSMINGLDAFIVGYNKTSGLELTQGEAFEAARMAILKLTLTAVGINKGTNVPSMYDEFINKTMKPLFDQIDNAQRVIQGKVEYTARPKPTVT